MPVYVSQRDLQTFKVHAFCARGYNKGRLAGPAGEDSAQTICVERNMKCCGKNDDSTICRGIRDSLALSFFCGQFLALFPFLAKLPFIALLRHRSNSQANYRTWHAPMWFIAGCATSATCKALQSSTPNPAIFLADGSGQEQ